MAERYMFTRNRQAPGAAQIRFFEEVSVTSQQTENKYFKIKKPRPGTAEINTVKG